MEKEKISIVVPVYKVEKYLDQCISSLVNQSYHNIEIILVDDGSPDNCPQICEDWKKKDSRIMVIHKKNGGLSDARNVGLCSATGELICFVDSDDFVEKDYIKKLYSALRENKADIAQCGIKKINNNFEIIDQIHYSENGIKTTEEMIFDSFNSNKIDNIVAWNRLYRKKIFDNILFPVGKIHEDQYTTYKLFYKVENVAIVSDCLYNYRIVDNSIMNSRYNIKRLDILSALEEKIEFFKNKKEEEFFYLTIIVYMHALRENYFNLRRYIDNSKDLQKEILKKYKKNYQMLKKYSKLNLKDKFKNTIFYYSPFLFNFIKKLKL